MITLTIHGIVWTINGKKDGKGVFNFLGCTVTYSRVMGVFQFKQGSNLILARESRGDCLRDATLCILDSFAAEFVPCWEYPSDGTAQKAA